MLRGDFLKCANTKELRKDLIIGLWEGLGDVGPTRYEAAQHPPTPTIKSYSWERLFYLWVGMFLSIFPQQFVRQRSWPRKDGAGPKNHHTPTSTTLIIVILLIVFILSSIFYHVFVS